MDPLDGAGPTVLDVGEDVLDTTLSEDFVIEVVDKDNIGILPPLMRRNDLDKGFDSMLIWKKESGSDRVHIGFISGSYRVYIGFISGSYRVYIGFRSGSDRVHIGFISGSDRVHIGFISGSHNCSVLMLKFKENQ